MAKVFTKLADKFPRWILLDRDEVVLDEDGKIKVFKSLKEIEFYIEVYFYEGCNFFFYKTYGSLS